MDVALHDTAPTMAVALASLLSKEGFKVIPPKSLSRDQLDAFVVGLIDGDGSLQVNHWRRKYLQFRLVVKLAFKPYNYEMLQKIAKVYGGNVRVTTEKRSGKKTVLWVIDDSNIIRNVIVPLLKKYTPLTTRVQLQLAFVIKALNGMSLEEFFTSRKSKYSTRGYSTEVLPQVSHTRMPSYFASWLGGFIEAEGCFSVRKAKNVISFSISQLHDLALVEGMLAFFGQESSGCNLTIQTKVLKSGHTLYEISIGSLAGISSVIKHCKPLLQGYKYVQLAQFVDKVAALRDLHSLFWKKR